MARKGLVAERLMATVDRLSATLRTQSFGAPVTHVYNPLDYARATHHEFLERFSHRRPEVLLLGMNPGPWGMAQTGIPFGAIPPVRDWLSISRHAADAIGHPTDEHPKRPIQGFDCQREEVSGARLWGWARDTYGTPERFFEQFFVYNYCPLIFLEASGRNRTPDKLPAEERNRLFAPCDEALRDTVEILGVERVIGIGAFAEKRASMVIENLPVDRILHPSPASPAANRGWSAAVKRQLEAIGISPPSRSL
ncbi:MAG: uracil-DNA glycosylase family protein [Acidobacteriota bacterium]